MHVGRQVKHAYARNDMLPFWLSLRLHSMFFFPAVSSSFFSCGFHFWHLTEKAEHRNSWLRPNTAITRHCHVHLCLSLWQSPAGFIFSTTVLWTVCLSLVRLRLLCGHSYVVETVALVATRKQTGSKFSWFSQHIFFFPPVSTHLPLVKKWLLAHWFGSSCSMDVEVIIFHGFAFDSLILPVGQNGTVSAA